MKKFRWAWVSRTETGGLQKTTVSLLEADGNLVRFWASLENKRGYYKIVALNKDRKGYSAIADPLSLKDAKEAVEKRLLDIGVIEEGDELEDYTDVDT